VAALMVVVYHATFFVLFPNATAVQWGSTSGFLWFCSRLSIGVTIFFVISGYCIFATTDAHSRSEHGAMAFAKRRFRRIYPPFWASLAVVVIGTAVVYLAGGCRRFTCRPPVHLFDWLANVSLTHTWLPRWLRHDATPVTINGVSWTLCYEEQFYLVCGVAVALSRRRFYALPIAVTVAVLGLAALGVLGIADLRPWVEGTFLDYKWLHFVIGGLLFYRLVKAPETWRWRIDLVFASLVIGLAAAMVTIPAYRIWSWANPLFQTWIASVCALLLVVLRSHEPSALRLLTGMGLYKPLKRIGAMSYSLYLVHLFIVSMVTSVLSRAGLIDVWSVAFIAVPVSVILSLAGAGLFFLGIERHFITWSSRRPKQIVALEFAS
jgi:peptidoglycan/LPS O-acetylase OafA/YrhL